MWSNWSLSCICGCLPIIKPKLIPENIKTAPHNRMAGILKNDINDLLELRSGLEDRGCFLEYNRLPPTADNRFIIPTTRKGRVKANPKLSPTCRNHTACHVCVSVSISFCSVCILTILCIFLVPCRYICHVTRLGCMQTSILAGSIIYKLVSIHNKQGSYLARYI